MLMVGVVDPSADAVWESVATIITKKGVEDRQPRTDAEWTAVRNHAIALTEAGNLLMIDPRPRDNDEWMKMARALVETSSRALRAAMAKDAKTLLAVGGDIDVACENCHVKYMPKGY